MAQQVHPAVEEMIDSLNSDETVDLVFVCENNRSRDVSKTITDLGDEIKSKLPGDVVVAEVTVSNITEAIQKDYIKSVSPDREARALA